jgi:hypothetical protein
MVCSEAAMIREPMKRLLIVGMFCVCAAQAQAASLTGKRLFEWCISDQRSVAYFHCVLFINGFISGYVAATLLAEKEYKSNELCLPSGLSTSEAAAAFVREWRSVELKKASSMEALKQADTDIALSFLLTQAFPCKKSNQDAGEQGDH